MIHISKTNINFVREPLIAPFAFKGGSLDELWQVVVKVESQCNYGVGIGVQSVLWSDASIFGQYSQASGNSFMFSITSYALKLIEGMSFNTPIDLLDRIFPQVYEYGKLITNNNELRMTFVLNALVAVDNAVWQLYARENDSEDIVKLAGSEYCDGLSYKHYKLCNAPLLGYAAPVSEAVRLANEGYFFLKIRIGSNPDKDNSLDKMLEWDKNRLKELHEALKDIKTPYTDNGHIAYYLDANGRYDTKERLNNFIDYAKEIGAIDRISILEEPFSEENKIDVSDLPLRIAADESAHTYENVIERIGLGYGAITLKPIAKTLSMTLKILKEAYKMGVPCYCADLTVNPTLLDFNKNIASRIAPLPGIKIGIMESNGPQNYLNWEQLKAYNPLYPSDTIAPQNGIFNLNEDYFRISGGIFRNSEYYTNIVK